MPVDKLGRHFLRTSPYNFPWRQQQQPDTLFLCQPSIKSECVLKISSDEKVSSSPLQPVVSGPILKTAPEKPNVSEFNYFLENGKNRYKFPVDGTLKGFTIFPTDTKVSFNNSDTLQSHWMLLEKEIKKGDTLSFFATTELN